MQESIIRGHPVYKAIWTPFADEKLTLEQERGNSKKKKKVTTIVGQVLKEHSKIYWNWEKEERSLVKSLAEGTLKRIGSSMYLHVRREQEANIESKEDFESS